MDGSSRFRGLAIGHVLGGEALVAEGFRARLLGLAHLDRDGAVSLLIPRCRCVHTFGMRFPLDLYFLASDGAIVASRLGMPPRRLAFCARASAVLEVPAEEGGEILALVP